MRRRITTAIVGVTAFVLLALGVPLALVAQRQILSSEVVELQAIAAQTLTEITLPLDADELAEVAREPDVPHPFTVYGADGRLIYGEGPPTADAVVLDALRGNPSSATEDLIVVATPITGPHEVIVGALRLSEHLSEANTRALRAWLVMALAGGVALGIAYLIARRLARRLSQPVTELAAAAAQLGNGGILARHVPVGIDEIDLLGATLVDGSQRVSEALARERRFSADVSHQLRTPLAGLRLKLEAAQTMDDNGATVASALDDLDRVEGTVSHLLAFARDAIAPRSTCSLAEAAQAAANRWRARSSDSARAIEVAGASSANVAAAQGSVDQILDVLVDNALTHGRGAVTLTVRTLTGGAAVDVTDDGSIHDNISDDELFRRGHGINHGIGLSLARSMAEAEGGRLMLLRRDPTTVSLVLLEAGD